MLGMNNASSIRDSRLVCLNQYLLVHEPPNPTSRVPPATHPQHRGVHNGGAHGIAETRR